MRIYLATETSIRNTHFAFCTIAITANIFFLIYNFLNLLISRIHDAPTKKRPCAINTYTFIYIAPFAASLAVYMNKDWYKIHIRTSNCTLHVDFHYVQWIEYRTDASTN